MNKDGRIRKMNEAFGANTEESRRLLLVQAELAVLSALERYDLQEEQIHFIQISDHITYQILSHSGDKFLLRIHPGSSSHEEIAPEIMWLDWLAERDGLIVPTGVVNRDGSFVTEVETDRNQRWPVTVLRWIDGEHCEEGLSDGQIYRMGALMARLHQSSQSFVLPGGLVRQTWGAASLEKDLERLRENHSTFLSADEFGLYEQAAGKIRAHISAIEPDSSQFGMIHADFHEGNLVFNEGQPYPIDFGRCGFGYYLYDMAQAFIGLYPLQRQMFIDGYESIRLLQVDSSEIMESFFIQALIENQSFHAPNPQEWAELKEQKPYALSLIRKYLSGAPFLFTRIN